MVFKRVTIPVDETITNGQEKYGILIVDDEISNLTSIKRLLEPKFNIFTAESGEVGLDILQNNVDLIQLIISDQRMPKMNGTEFLANSMAINPQIIRIILTGYTDVNEIIETINKSQIYRYLTKPIDPQDMILTVERALDSYKLESSNRQLVIELQDLNSSLESKVKDRTLELKNLLKIIKDDHSVACKIQRSLIPDWQIDNEVISIYSHYLPMQEVGGDFLEISEIHENYYRIFIADATGHGVQAALITMLIHGEYKSLRDSNLLPGEILDRLNQVIHLNFKMSYAIFPCALLDLDLNNKKLYFASAGLDEQLLVSGSKYSSLSKTGRILGVLPESNYGTHERTFEKGDRIFLFTDGISEQTNSNFEEYGFDRLLKCLESNKHAHIFASIDLILQDLRNFSGVLESNKQNDDSPNSSFMDDISVIALEIK